MSRSGERGAAGRASASPHGVLLSVPSWVRSVAAPGIIRATHEARMRLAIRLARENVRRGTGGPFGAAVFRSSDGRLVGAAVNRVVPDRCFASHAEVVALGLAQAGLQRGDPGGDGMAGCELVTSTEPCAMCLGAIPWSGVRSLVCGARSSDARAVGFDEGDRPRGWVGALRARGIAVRRGLLRAEAAAVLRDYARCGGPIYNGRRGVA